MGNYIKQQIFKAIQFDGTQTTIDQINSFANGQASLDGNNNCIIINLVVPSGGWVIMAPNGSFSTYTATGLTGGNYIALNSAHPNPYAPSGGFVYSTNSGSTWNDLSNAPNYTMVFEVDSFPLYNSVTTSASIAIAPGSVVGQLLSLESQTPGTITIKNAANTQLPSQADYVLNQRSVMQLVWDGTFWTTQSVSVN